MLASLTYKTTDGSGEEVESDALGNPGVTDDWAKSLDGTIKVSWKNLVLNTNYINRKHGPYVGVKNVLNDDSELRTEQFFADITYNKALNKE